MRRKFKKRCEKCSRVYIGWRQNQKFCSRDCAFLVVRTKGTYDLESRHKKSESLKGRKIKWKNKLSLATKHYFSNPQNRKKASKIMKVVFSNPIIREKISISNKGKIENDRHPNWKGGNVGYDALHDWVRRKLGYAQRCQHCGEEGQFVNGKWSIELANKSGKYLRNLSDWLRLCVKCHRIYDKESYKNCGVNFYKNKLVV